MECTREKKLLIIVAITLTIGITFAIVLTHISHFKEPLPPNSPVIRNWMCKEGKAWSFGKHKIVSACKDEYIDIREVLDGKVTAKGIKLTIQEWHDLISTNPSVNNFV